MHALLLITHTCCVQPPHFCHSTSTIENHFQRHRCRLYRRFFFSIIYPKQRHISVRQQWIAHRPSYRNKVLFNWCLRYRLAVWEGWPGWFFTFLPPIPLYRCIYPAAVGSNLDFIEQKLLYSRPIWWGSATLLHLKYVIIIIKIIFWFMSSHMFCCWFAAMRISKVFWASLLPIVVLSWREIAAAFNTIQLRSQIFFCVLFHGEYRFLLWLRFWIELRAGWVWVLALRWSVIDWVKSFQITVDAI